MKLSILQETLKAAIDTVKPAVASRSTLLPVLANILLAADGERVRLSANNFELGISCPAAAKVERAGAITLPGKLLAELVSSLPPERVDIELNETTLAVEIRCGANVSTVKGISAEEFPVLPEQWGEGERWIFEPEQLARMVKQTTFATCRDDSRPVFTGALFRLAGGKLTLAAADGFRLALNEGGTLRQAQGAQATELIIPARLLNEAARLITAETETVMVGPAVGDRAIVMEIDGVKVTGQALEGMFPDFNRIIPDGFTGEVIAETAALRRALRISNLFAADSAGIVRFTVGAERLVLNATSAELGESENEVAATVSGEPVTVAFNAAYVSDFLKVVQSPQVLLRLGSASAPGVFRPVGGEEFTYVVMPMHLGGQ
jgi:DNA polymerase-3 subunit beta